MFVYRIVLKEYAKSLEAPGIAGRWNTRGSKVIYAAESIPVAFMENMIRRKGIGFNDQFAIMAIEVHDSLKITEIDPVKLPDGWRDYNDYSICQSLGSEWYEKSVTPVLKVPSAVLITNFNYVLNATHPDFAKIKIVHVSPLIPDERIEAILKAKK